MHHKHPLLWLLQFYGFIHGFECYKYARNTSSDAFSFDRVKRQWHQSCAEFSCRSGECISESLVCDGKKHCKDRSDETSETCLERLLPVLAVKLEPPLITFIDKCPPSQYSCGYSKCIDLNKICDGKKNCPDGSDEDKALCSTLHSPVNTQKPSTKPSESPTIETASNCKLPEYPANGKYQITGCNECGPGTVVSKTTILVFDCDKGFKLSSNPAVWCEDGLKWSSPFPKCQKVLCPPLQDSTRKIICRFAYEEVKCSEGMLPSTVALISCNSYYTASPGLYSYLMSCNENGEWSHVIHPCVPECGVGSGKVRPFVSYGFRVEAGEYPWHVAIYQKTEDSLKIICGGSIIRPNLILSAAHCFWSELTKQTISIDEFKIAAGKLFRDWIKRNNNFQEAVISNITVHPYYNGESTNYAEDIAIVILKRSLVINEYVKPICVDFHNQFSVNIEDGGITGIVAGWGYTQNQTFSEELRGVVIPVWDKETCIKSLPGELLPHIAHRDKFCAGTKTGTTVCIGDSGGGFVVRLTDNAQYFLMGIVSVGLVPLRENCDLKEYALFTKTSEHISFINQFISTSLTKNN